MRPSGLAALVLSALLLGACVGTPALDPQRTAVLPVRAELATTPFYPQEADHCGPASLAMVLTARGMPAEPKNLAPTVFLPARKGSLPLDMLGGARRAGAVAMRTPPSLESVMEHVASGLPVIVLQNLSLPIYPMWHYAVVVGFDRAERVLYLRSGLEERQVIGWGTFDRTWARSGRWAMIATSPGDMPPQAERAPYVEAALALERLGKTPQANLAYEAGVRRWPGDLTLAVGAGNTAYAVGDLDRSERAFREALEHHPASGAILNNLANVLARAGRLEEAESLAERAVSIPGSHHDAALGTLQEIRERRTAPSSIR